MKEPNKRERQRAERYEQIIKCALDLIISRGFDAVKVRDIARELNMSTGLLFNYFSSKEALYEELVKIGLSGPASALAMNTEGVEPIELFERMASYIFSALRADPFTGKMFLLMSQSMKLHAVPESVKNLLAGLDAVTPLVPVIARGQVLGQIKTGDPRALAGTFWSAVCGVAESYVLQPNFTLPESSWIVDIVRA